MKNMKLLLLWPFTLLYSVIVTLRNRNYLNNSDKRTSFSEPVVVVGNLTVGGTGKTPHVEYLADKFLSKLKLGLLSRGYGRQTKGFYWGDDKATANLIGDEPMQYVHKFGNETKIAVCENRVEGIRQMKTADNELQGFLLDDAFQHLRLKASTYVLLTDYNRLFTKDYVMPSGLLRESRNGAKRADVVIVTKCPEDITFVEEKEIQTSISKYTSAPVFFTKTITSSPVDFETKQILEEAKEVFLLSGIAQNEDFAKRVSGSYSVKKHFAFADHHNFTTDQLQKIVDEVAGNNSVLVTTEKDYMRLMSVEFKDIIAKIPIFVVPLKVEFLEREDDFLSLMAKAFKVSE